GGQVRGPVLAGRGADNARLRHVDVAGTTIEQREGLVAVWRDGVLRQLGTNQLRAQRIEGQAQDVGGDFDLAGLGVGGGGLVARHRGYRSGSGRRRSGGHTGVGHLGLLLGLDFSVGGLRGEAGPEHRGPAVIRLPVVPQQQQREGQNHPEDGASDIHSAFYKSKRGKSVRV